MKKLLIAFSMVGAGALIACAEDAGAQSNSVTTNYAHDAWFSASANGTTLNEVGGNFSVKTDSASSYKANGGKIEIDGDDVTDPVSFKVDDSHAKTTGLAKVTFDLDASVVPDASLQKMNMTGVKTAFALVASMDKTTTNFQAWVKQGDQFGWQTLEFAIPDVDAPYDLTMRFDDSADVKKVQFAVKLDGQTSEVVSDWYTYGGLALQSKPQIDFVGCGKLNSMNADQVAIVSSEIIFEGGSVTIAEKDAAAMGSLVQPNETIEDVLKADVASRFSGDISENCKLSVAEAYAIGLIAKKSGSDEMEAKDDGNFKVETVATAKVAGNKIAVKFVNELTPADPDVTITYSLLGQKTAGDEWTEIAGVQNKETVSDVAIPTEAVAEGYRYFKVVTKVQLKDAN